MKISISLYLYYKRQAKITDIQQFRFSQGKKK